MKRLSSLSFLIPAYNDEDTIEIAIKEAVEVGKSVSRTFDIFVINDCSPDTTKEILDRLVREIPELHVIHHEKNLGYGGTIRELYEQGRGEYLYTIPGDYQIGANELLKLIPAIDHADMVIGWRVDRHDPESRLRQSKIYNQIARLLFRFSIHDVNSVRLMKSSIMKHFHLTTTSAFVDIELLVRTLRAGFVVSEVPIEHRKRQVSEATAGGGKVGTILPTITDMIKFFFIR